MEEERWEKGESGENSPRHHSPPLSSASDHRTPPLHVLLPPQTLNLKPVPPHLSEPYLAEVRSLLPRLLALGHHSDAVRLLSAALLLSPPLSSLPIPSLARHLSSLPDLAPTLALLTSLRHHPLRPSPLPFVAPLLSSFLLSRRPRDAAKVFFWLCRADSPPPRPRGGSDRRGEGVGCGVEGLGRGGGEFDRVAELLDRFVRDWEE
uniref:Uncharacterized protein n=1 Tax=Ananas comosus var. bracteatus TaxID=296719 RepID=A0A6V7QAT3_ANACO|nr:unnamed protein product [Ananas comosus var. bracteatus]